MRNAIIELKKELSGLADEERAEVSQRFFKTGKGEYGEGDVFIGLTVPQSRKIAIKFRSLSFADILKLLKSKIHEERLIALLILVNRFDVGSEEEKKNIFDFYLKNAKCVNNWDLVDLSADKIVGAYILGRGPVRSFPPASARSTSAHVRAVGSPSSSATPPILIKLAKSENLWERRIAIVATYYFIKNNKFGATLKIAEILLNDKHDLIHKAVGWMLREVGKKDLKTEIGFLNKHYKQMPRTMLRYAIEKFPDRLRTGYLKFKIRSPLPVFGAEKR
ncbi:MAG: DNA alkylation repair protein [Candidatus Levybacteria bacterium]|nr:DNA alkylation repair protein [Candidatus Levybacteria bacterium]